MDARGIAGVALEVTVTAEGELRRVRIVVQDSDGLVGSPEATVAAADCPDAAEAVAMKVFALLSEVRPWLVEAPPLLQAVEVPIGASVGVALPGDLRGEAGVRVVLAPGRVRVLVGAQAGAGSGAEVASGVVRFGDALALAGLGVGAGEGRLDAGLYGGASVGWGGVGLSGAAVGGTAGVWGEVSAPMACGLRVGLGARVSAARLAVCTARLPMRGACPEADLVAEPWVRAEARVVPTFGARRENCGSR